MAGFSLTAVSVFPSGTVVGVYPETSVPSGHTGPPMAASVTNATMGTTSAEFTGLTSGARYIAAAQVGGVWRYQRIEVAADVDDEAFANRDETITGQWDFDTTPTGIGSGPPTGAAGGDLTGTYPNPTIQAEAIQQGHLSPDIELGGGGSGLVDSVFGRAGVVTAAEGDYTPAQVGAQDVTEKDQANGYAGLSAGGKISVGALPAGAMTFKGVYNATTDSPALQNGTGTTGDLYKVSVAGTQDFGAGNIVLAVDDSIVYDGTIWSKIASSASGVSSVDGLTGPVTLPVDEAAATGSHRTLGDGALQAAPGTVQATVDAMPVINTTGLVADDLLQWDGTQFVRYDGGLTVNPTLPHARVYNSAALSIPSTPFTALTFNSERWDNDSIHSTVTNTGRLTAQTTGLYSIFANVRFATNSIGQRGIRFMHNGATAMVQIMVDANAASPTDLSVNTQFRLSSTNYVTCEVFQSSGGALDASATNFSPEFGMALISA